MSKLRYSLLDIAIAIAGNSNSKRYKVGAVADGNHGYSVACNVVGKTHPKLQSLGYPIHAGQHAEFRLVMNYPVSVRGAVVYIARTNRNGKIKMARPCPACEGFLRAAGVRKVVYTTPNGAGTMKL